MFQKILEDYLQQWSASGNKTPHPLPLKQSSWDHHGIEKDWESIESGLSTRMRWVRLKQTSTITDFSSVKRFRRSTASVDFTDFIQRF